MHYLWIEIFWFLERNTSAWMRKGSESAWMYQVEPFRCNKFINNNY